jgi:isopenicillin N synthase-like dioxygenase
MNVRDDVFHQARLFFARPLEEKMKVCTDLMPEEFCGYHPSERYNWEGAKRAGQSINLHSYDDNVNLLP